MLATASHGPSFLFAMEESFCNLEDQTSAIVNRLDTVCGQSKSYESESYRLALVETGNLLY